MWENLKRRNKRQDISNIHILFYWKIVRTLKIIFEILIKKIVEEKQYERHEDEEDIIKKMDNVKEKKSNTLKEIKKKYIILTINCYDGTSSIFSLGCFELFKTSQRA